MFLLPAEKDEFIGNDCIFIQKNKMDEAVYLYCFKAFRIRYAPRKLEANEIKGFQFFYFSKTAPFLANCSNQAFLHDLVGGKQILY